jgi:hypothetical protein
LAELAGQVLLDRIPVYGLLHARIDTGQNHGLVVSFGCEREMGSEGEGRGANADGADQVPAIERACKTVAARAGNLMQIFHCPSLGDDATQLTLAGNQVGRNGKAVSQGKNTVARADARRRLIAFATVLTGSPTRCAIHGPNPCMRQHGHRARPSGITNFAICEL